MFCGLVTFPRHGGGDGPQGNWIYTYIYILCIYAYMHICRFAYMHISPIISRSSSSTTSSRSSISTSNIDQVGSEIHSKSTKLEAKIVPNRSQEASQGGSWGILGGSWGQEGPKSQKCSKNQTLVSPIGGQVGSQNRPKSIKNR